MCRLEFDAYRSDLEELSLGQRDAAAVVRIDMAQQEYQLHRDKYERLRSDVTIKLKFLEENKVCSCIQALLKSPLIFPHGRTHFSPDALTKFKKMFLKRVKCL